MDNYICDYVYNEGDITIRFKCNNQTVYSFVSCFDIFYENFVSIYSKNDTNKRYELINSNGVIQVVLHNNFLSFEISRYGNDVYGESIFTIKLNDKFDNLIDELKKLHQLLKN